MMTSKKIDVRFSFLLISLVFHLVIGQTDEELRDLALKNGINPDDSESIMLSPPKLSPEEEGSQFMPKAHRCDACTAIAYLLEKQFKIAEKKTKKGSRLSEADILSVTEEVCDSEFHGYGLKNVQGKNYISGEGLDANDEPGMIEAGGKWAKRFQNMCKEIMGEYEEEGVYNYYMVKKIPLKAFICGEYCEDDEHVVKPFKDEF